MSSIHTPTTEPAVPTPQASPEGSGWEVGDILRTHGEAYRQTHLVTPLEHEVMQAIATCRTEALGGHLEQCDACGFERPAYNSCRNRHCPKCQCTTKARWLDARNADLLPVVYFHNVFTLPHEINPVALANKRVIYNLLFRSVADMLKEFGADPEHKLGGKIGFTALLHTWNQLMRDHIHLHCIVPGGALSNDGMRWVPVRNDFLFPRQPLAEVFRGKFIDGLETAFSEGDLRMPGQRGQRHARAAFRKLVDSLWSKDWIVFSKKAFSGPEKVLDYLGRYTHRVAISNHRIINVKGDLVTFSYRDRSDNNTVKEKTISAEDFIERFLLHVLPKGFMRVRHFGFLGNRGKKGSLSRCRQLLGLPAEAPKPEEKSTEKLILELTGIDVTKCPQCKEGVMHAVRAIPKPAPVRQRRGMHPDRPSPTPAAARQHGALSPP